MQRLGPLEQAHSTARHLAELVTGNSPSARIRMQLEAYVLAARLEEVVTAANTRLHIMSEGRYTLSHSDHQAARGARSGLGLQITDSWTGRPRKTDTLSGGESFFASLSLALGLADVVTHEAGGNPWTPSSSTKASAPSTKTPSSKSSTSWTPCTPTTAPSASSATSPNCAAASPNASTSARARPAPPSPT